MTHLDYENICRAVSIGKDRVLENRKTHYVGHVLSCRSDYFNVAVGEGWQVWSREVCEEATAEGEGKRA